MRLMWSTTPPSWGKRSTTAADAAFRQEDPDAKTPARESREWSHESNNYKRPPSWSGPGASSTLSATHRLQGILKATLSGPQCRCSASRYAVSNIFAEPKNSATPPAQSTVRSGADSSASHPSCFDAASAHYPTHWVSTRRVIDLLRLTHRPDCVSAYRENMLRGETFPPISVIPLAGFYLVADGHKRLRAFLGLVPDAEAMIIECWPWRRWARDQWEQFLRKQQHFAAALRGGPGSRRVLIDLISGTMQHWWRVARSLSSFAVPRRPDRDRRDVSP